MKRVLLLAADGEIARNVQFLLRLAGYSTFRSHEAREAANKILYHQQGQPIDLIVVDRCKTPPDLQELAETLENAGMVIPFLIIQRGGSSIPPLPPHHQLCLPTSLLKGVEEIFSHPAKLPPPSLPIS